MTPTELRLADALSAAATAVREDELRPLVVPARPRRRRRLTPAAAAVAVVLVASLVALLPHHRGGPPPGPAAPVVRLGSAGVVLSALAVDSASHTLYLAGYVRPGPRGVLTMIDTRTCNAAERSGCAVTQVRTSALGAGSSIAVNERTHTLYATADVIARHRVARSVVSVLSTATCRAGDGAGCRTALAAVPISAGVAGLLAINQATDTVYVETRGPARGSAMLSVINGKTCNASETGGCAGRPATIPLGIGGFVTAVDPATNTLYAGSGSGVAVIDTTSCDSRTSTGCGRPPRTFSVGSFATGIAVDEANHTLYVSRDGSLVSVIDRDACNAAAMSGCGRQAVVTVGAAPWGGALVDPTGTLYVLNRLSGTVSMIDATTCAAADTSGCGSVPPEFPVGIGPGPAVIDPAAHTIYLLGSAAHGTILSMINSRTCTAASTRGCPGRAPAGTFGGPDGTVQACSPAVLPATSGEPAWHFTPQMTQVAAGMVAGQPWTLWARQGEPQPRALEDGGIVLSGRWYGLCTGYSNVAEMALIAAPGRGIAYGLVTFHFRVRVRLTVGQSQVYPPVVWLRRATFFVGVLPRSACAYPSIRLHASYRDVPGGRRGGYYSGISWHQFSYGSCQPNRVVAITEETGSVGYGWAASP